MLNKNDPLIGAVQEVMRKNHAEREAIKAVNEKFGVTDRKALPHEKQGAWNTAYQQVLNESDEMGPIKARKNEGQLYRNKKSGKENVYTKHPGDEWEVVKEELKGNQHKIDVAKPYGKLTHHDFKKLGSMEEEMTPEQKKNARIKAILKKRMGKEGAESVSQSRRQDLEEKAVSKAQHRLMGAAYAVKKGSEAISPKVAEIAASMSKKELKKYAGTKEKGLPEKVDEGFSIRHGLSVTASAEKQAVADINEQENPITAQRKKYREKQKQAESDKRMTSRIKAREPKETSSFERFQTRQQQSPAPVLGGPPVMPGPGVAQNVARMGIAALPRVMNYLRNLGKGTSQQTSNLAAGAARRTDRGSVPPVSRTGGPPGRYPPSGAWGSIRRGGNSRAAQGNRQPSAATSGNFQGRLAQLRPQTQQSRVGTSTVAANQAAAARTSSQALGGFSRVPSLGKLQGGKPQTIPQDMSRSINVPPAIAEPKEKLYTDRVPEEKPNKTQDEPKTQEIPQRKLDTPTRKVTDTQIMNAPQYKQAVKDVGGEAAARRIQPGRDVAGVGKVEKGETIWSKVKSQLEKQPAPAPKGFEMGNTKGGAGR